MVVETPVTLGREAKRWEGRGEVRSSAWFPGCPNREQRDPIYLKDKVTQRHSKEQFETAQKIEQEYSRFFTGRCASGLQRRSRQRGRMQASQRRLPRSGNSPHFRGARWMLAQ